MRNGPSVRTRLLARRIVGLVKKQRDQDGFMYPRSVLGISYDLGRRNQPLSRSELEPALQHAINKGRIRCFAIERSELEEKFDALRAQTRINWGPRLADYLFDEHRVLDLSWFQRAYIYDEMFWSGLSIIDTSQRKWRTE